MAAALAGRIYKLQSVHSKPNGVLWLVKDMLLTDGKVIVDDIAALGRWCEEDSGSLLHVVWSCHADENNLKTNDFVRIRGTASWVQIDCDVKWQGVFVPPMEDYMTLEERQSFFWIA